MAQRRILITGANRGIGWGAAEALAREGFAIVMACRNAAKAEDARARLVSMYPACAVEIRQVDMASFASIRRLAADLLAEGRPIDVLINNAAVLADHFERTEDGYELAMGVNFLGPCLLTMLLLPLIETVHGRIINTCSSTFRIGRTDVGFDGSGRRRYRPIQAYGDSKLALLMFTIELAERLGPEGPTVFAVDPGVSDTGMIRLNRWFDPLTDLLFRPLIQDEDGAARGTVEMAAAIGGHFESGGYYRRRRRIRITRRALDKGNRTRLWMAAGRAIGL